MNTKGTLVSVLAVITNEKEAIAFTRWGFQLARARQTPLVLIKAEEKDIDYDAKDIDLEKNQRDSTIQLMIETLQDEIRISEDITATPHYEYHDEETISEHMINTPDCSIKSVRGRKLEKPVLKLVDTDKASLLIAGRHDPLKGKNHFTDYIFHKVHCDTMVVRLGEAEFKRCAKLLIPSAGGPHCRSALMEGARLAHAQGTAVTPLLIETEGEYSHEVGENTLNDVLKECGIKETSFITPRVEVTEDVVAGISHVAKEGFDLVVVGASEMGNIRQKLFGILPDSLMNADPSLSIGVYRSRKSNFEKYVDKFEYWCNIRIPQMTRDDRIKLYNNLHVNSNWNFDFISLICLSTAIASLGLISNSAAVVIGAMLIAPLMVPILAAGLAIVQGNLPLIFNSIKSIILGFLSALVIGFFCGIFAPIEHITSEIMARGEPKMADLFIALFSGIAAAHCMSRPKLSAALPGVAIAAALVPPIASTGISLAHGEGATAQGAALLFFTNVICIIIGSAFAFYAAGIRPQQKTKNRQIWVKRAIISLVLTTALLVLPLSSALLKRLGQLVLKHKLLSNDEIAKFCTPVLKDLGLIKINDVKYEEIDESDSILVTLLISSSQMPTQETIITLEAILTEKMTRTVDVQIVPTFIIK